MHQFSSPAFPQAKIITLPSFADERGLFVKTFQQGALKDIDVAFEVRESYFSISKKNVIRGMHFQLPPYQHSKIVFCPQGAILDVVIDLRRESPDYKQFISVELSAENHKAVIIPEGYAHGFLALADDVITYYLVTSEYDKEHDSGIRYDSFGLDWDTPETVVSARDNAFVALKDFDSPF